MSRGPGSTGARNRRVELPSRGDGPRRGAPSRGADTPDFQRLGAPESPDAISGMPPQEFQSSLEQAVSGIHPGEGA
eukprot:15462719-Alexandrium_andersonii.AAC.1